MRKHDLSRWIPPLALSVIFVVALFLSAVREPWIVTALWVLVPIAAIGTPILDVIHRRALTAPRPPSCRRCYYNLTGNVSGRCPECGMETESK